LDACDPDGQAIEVHKCDGRGKADFAFLKSIFRRAVKIVYRKLRIAKKSRCRGISGQYY
jgi:hypothetical protein